MPSRAAVVAAGGSVGPSGRGGARRDPMRGAGRAAWAPGPTGGLLPAERSGYVRSGQETVTAVGGGLGMGRQWADGQGKLIVRTGSGAGAVAVPLEIATSYRAR